MILHVNLYDEPSSFKICHNIGHRIVIFYSGIGYRIWSRHADRIPDIGYQNQISVKMSKHTYDTKILNQAFVTPNVDENTVIITISCTSIFERVLNGHFPKKINAKSLHSILVIVT